MKMKILRRNDGKEFCFSEDTAGLAKRADMRLIEVEIDPVTKKRVKEIDLTMIGSATTDKALREAVAKKWPHLVPLIDRPDLVRVALAGAPVDGLPNVDLTRFDLVADAEEQPLPGKPDESAKGGIVTLPGVEDVDAVKPGGDDEDVPPAGPPADQEGEQKPVDPIEAAVQEFVVRLRASSGRPGVREIVAEEGLAVDDQAKSAMIEQAAKLYREKLLQKG